MQPEKQSQKKEDNIPNEKQEYEKQLKLYEEQQEKIRLQITEQSDLVGEKRDISMMLDQFLNNEGFYIKVQKMHEQYQYYRKIRRDGACFYRALTYCILEAIHIKKDEKLKTLMLQKMKNATPFLTKAKFEGFIFEDIVQVFQNAIKSKQMKKQQDVVKYMNDPQTSNYLVLLLRYLTSGELKNNSEKYQFFIEEGIPIETFCQLEVEQIDKQADQIQMMALLNYLQVGIKIIYLDSNTNNKEASSVIMPENISKENVKATLLYRPGHYDVLYSL